MPFAEKDVKLLWGRAAGICSNPGCRVKLTAVGAGGISFLTGEMAHQIAQSPKGPRGGTAPGSDEYDNLLLLCPQCHTTIDKAPEGTFTVDMLKDWKQMHEAWVDSWSAAPKYQILSELARAVLGILAENRAYFDEYGPKSKVAQNDPGSSTHAVWVARKLDTILPNNRRIVQILEANASITPGSLSGPTQKFKLHARGFEDNQYDRVEHYPLFPDDFKSALEGLVK
jgi:hypothetical protein